ncbi:hypothetical protein LTR50_005144 [Elasticomyces elasticus]|nr:hypothetical protein LTR50_005144 [Elasticomyces elasticus]
MPAPTLWERARWGGKAGFDKVYGLVDKLGAPVNKLSNKLGSEAFWPTTLDVESDKAARILRSFCKDGFYQEETQQPISGPRAKQKVLKKIPAEVIRNAKGLAIFTTMRTGLWVSGAGGSGILVGRTLDGSWSPPSGIMLHTAGLGFLVGVDIYDCVVVINTQNALDAFSKLRCTLGGEISAVAGPVGAGGILETEIHRRQAPVFTYLKSRGFYAGIQIDGTVVIERTDENERFYGQKISVGEIMAGKVRHAPYETKKLLETIKAAQGDQDVDETMLPSEPPPSDYEIVEDGHAFGVPDKEDPDPYGVLALEKEGMGIREAGTHKRASWEDFTFHPAPSSPIYSTYSKRLSQDRDSRSTHSVSRRSSWRTSTQSYLDKTVTTADMSTQTDIEPSGPPSPDKGSARSSRRESFGAARHGSMDEIPEHEVLPSPQIKAYSNGQADQHKHTPSPSPHREAHGVDDDEEEAVIEEPVVHSVQTIQKASAPKVISAASARLVTVPKRVTPRLPPRNPNRSRGPLVINADQNGSSDADSTKSPVSPTEQADSGTLSSVSPTEARNPLDRHFSDVSLDDEEETSARWEKLMPNPNTTAQAAEGRKNSSDSMEMPGAFR